jgi:hypothetical protein
MTEIIGKIVVEGLFVAIGVFRLSPRSWRRKKANRSPVRRTPAVTR